MRRSLSITLIVFSGFSLLTSAAFGGIAIENKPKNVLATKSVIAPPQTTRIKNNPVVVKGVIAPPQKSLPANKLSGVKSR